MSSDKKTILFVCNTDWFFLSHRTELAVAVMQEGFEVHLAAPIADKAEELSVLCIETHSIPMTRTGGNPFSELRTLWSLWRVLRRVDPTIVHAITPKPTLYMAFLARVAKTPKLVLAVSGLGHVFSSSGCVSWLRRVFIARAYKLLLKHPNMSVIFQNNSDREVLEGVSASIANCSVLINGSGVDLSRFGWEPENSSHPLRIVMACRLLWEKGVAEFVQAAKIVRCEFPDVQFDLFGKIDDHPSAVPQVTLEEWAEEGIVNWRGYTDNVSSVFRDSNIVVHPSYYGEGMPKVLLEAAASGRPVVTTDFPGCRDAVVAGVTGLLVKPRDPGSLADAVSTLIQDGFLRQEMGRKGRLLAESKFSVQDVVQQHLEIYMAL
jgi:glycosyltransferase involved in cell wall biosynthesis